jgi:metal-responsive CopG/Arc/MetJ family transcriptional regulator
MSRTTVIVGFSVPPDIADEVKQVAKAERRTKSELFREMLRVYQTYRRKRRQDEEDRLVTQVIEEIEAEKARQPVTAEVLEREGKALQQAIAAHMQKLGIQEEDVAQITKDYRSEQRA